MSSVARYLGLQSPKSNLFFWQHITFQVTEVDKNYKPTQKNTSRNTNLYTTVFSASPNTKLLFKVRNECSVPTRLLLGIKAHNHSFYKTITLENNSYYDLVCMEEDCSLEIMHIGLDGQQHYQEHNKYIFHVQGLQSQTTPIWHNDIPTYHRNEKKLFWGVIDFFLSEYDQDGNLMDESSLYLPGDLKESVEIQTENMVNVAVRNNCFVRVRLVLKKTDKSDQIDTYQTCTLQPRETYNYFMIDEDTTVQVMHISTEDGKYTKFEQSDLLIDFLTLHDVK